MISEELPPLPKEAIALLQQQKITETEPGTILQDFQTLLDFVGEEGIPVSIDILRYLKEADSRILA